MKAFVSRFGNVLGLFVAWLTIYLVYGAFIGPHFLSVAALEQIARQGTVVALASVGMTYVIITAGIDLSVGAMVAFVSVVIAYSLERGSGPLLAMVFGLLAGGACGLLNGVLITGLRVTPFIVTLGNFLAVRGMAKGFSGEQKIDAPMTWISDLISKVPKDERWKFFPPAVWFMLFLAVLAAVVLKHTRFGRHVVAVGSNEHAARLCGVPVARVKASVYMIAGLCAGLAGIALFGRLSVGDPTAALGLELQVIAAVVIGGASLAGGTGSVGGTLIGVLIMETIRAGSSQLGWPNWVQEIVTGAIIVIAVALDQVRHRRAT